MNKIISHFLTFLVLSVITFAQNNLIHHEINANVQPSSSFVEVTDEIIIPESMLNKELIFILHNALTVSILTPRLEIEKINEGINAEDVGMDREETESSEVLKLNEYRIICPASQTGDLIVSIKYSGKIESPIEQSDENYARGFSESPGIIADIGVYLAGSTYWVPHFNDELITFNLTSTLPKDWKNVSVGKRTIDEIRDNNHIDRWESPTAQEEVFLIAAAFNEYSFPMGSVTAYAFLRSPDEGLANKYLESDYI